MNQFDQFIAALNALGFKQEGGDGRFVSDRCYCITEEKGVELLGREVTIGQGEGYSGFHAAFRFTPDGRFINYGVWE